LRLPRCLRRRHDPAHQRSILARAGAKIRYRKSNNCTDTVFTVTADSEKQKANLCK
jgi:hypothetical protein